MSDLNSYSYSSSKFMFTLETVLFISHMKKGLFLAFPGVAVVQVKEILQKTLCLPFPVLSYIRTCCTYSKIFDAVAVRVTLQTSHTIG